MPYEVHGGVALHTRKLWPFVQALMTLEQACFGDRLARFQKEIKGSHLLDKDRFKWAAQAGLMEDTLRRRHCLSFLNKGLNKQPPIRDEFTAYGQACLQVADVVIYALNWGFRLPQLGMNTSTRPDIEAEFAGLIGNLQFRGEGYRDGNVFQTFGIVYVPDLYTPRT
ncbi:MAG: hypothetical protein LV480_00815 [Methylacidiphilales bacterium]|nr:hypothetical protein [Candidatus Methylacidiphilales bacterium]